LLFLELQKKLFDQETITFTSSQSGDSIDIKHSQQKQLIQLGHNLQNFVMNCCKLECLLISAAFNLDMYIWTRLGAYKIFHQSHNFLRTSHNQNLTLAMNYHERDHIFWGDFSSIK
jgi:hypothetical protein